MKYNMKLLDDILTIIVTLTMIAGIGVFVTFICFMLTFLIPQLKGEYSNYTNIVSLERGSEVNGVFVLGFGGMYTSQVYYAYSKVGNNQYVLKSFSLKSNGISAIILETEQESPKFLTEKICTDKTKFGLKKNIWGQTFKKCHIRRTIVVPKGTIQKTFNG